jgi:hypothetical protein
MYTYIKWTKSIITLILILSASAIFAGQPVWTFTPLTETRLSLPFGAKATVQYRVTNQSRKPHTLMFSPVTGIRQITTAGNCSNPFYLNYQNACVLTLEVDSSLLSGNVSGGPVVCQQGSKILCFQPSQPDILNITQLPAPGQTTLQNSIASLALSTSGNARIITITNNGSETAYNVNYSASPALPSDTTISPSSCGSIAPSGSCVLTITPGSTPSAAPGDTNPTPVSLTVSGINTNNVVTSLSILSYGSVYQSGYLFAIDDSTANTGSIGGKVASLNDQADPFPNGIIWSSNGNSGDAINAVFDDIPGIYESSTNPPDVCDGNSDGQCNSQVIVNYYSPPQTNPAVNFSFYAAGRCQGVIDGYSDWYLPSICEMGYDRNGAGSGCGSAASPLVQNMQSNLVDLGNIGGLSQNYWSSTEFSGTPSDTAFTQLFGFPIGEQAAIGKEITIAVRCVRRLTP